MDAGQRTYRIYCEAVQPRIFLTWDGLSEQERTAWAAVEAARAPQDSFERLVAEGRAEAARAMAKFPQPNYVISKVAEEAGEVVKAAIHAAERRESLEAVAREMRQLIAMLYRLWIEGDQVHGLPPIKRPFDE